MLPQLNLVLLSFTSVEHQIHAPAKGIKESVLRKESLLEDQL